MYFEINISLHGHHFFATSERSITDGIKLLRVYNQLAAKFTKAEGFEINVRQVHNVKTAINIDEMLAGGQ